MKSQHVAPSALRLSQNYIFERSSRPCLMRAPAAQKRPNHNMPRSAARRKMRFAIFRSCWTSCAPSALRLSQNYIFERSSRSCLMRAQIVWDEIIVSKPDLSTVKFQKPTDEFLNFRQLENAIFGNSILNGGSAHPHPIEVNDFFVNLKVAFVGDWLRRIMFDVECLLMFSKSKTTRRRPSAPPSAITPS